MISALLGTFALLFAGANPTVDWVDERRVKVSADFDASNPNTLFGKGEKELKRMANEACATAYKGKATIEGEAMVIGIAITPEGKRQATLSATYICG